MGEINYNFINENLGATNPAVSNDELLEINFLLEFIKMFVLLKLKKTIKYPPWTSTILKKIYLYSLTLTLTTFSVTQKQN